VAQFCNHFVHSAIHDPWALQRGRRLCLEGAKFSFPVEPELRGELKTVGVLRRRADPSGAVSCTFALASIGPEVVAARALARIAARTAVDLRRGVHRWLSSAGPRQEAPEPVWIGFHGRGWCSTRKLATVRA